MKNVAAQIFLVGLIVFATSSRGFGDERKTYTGSGPNSSYSMEYLSDWNPIDIFGNVKFVAPTRDSSGRLSGDGVLVSIVDLSKKPMQLQEFVLILKKIGPVGASSFRILDEGEARVSNRSGWFLIYVGIDADPLGLRNERNVKGKWYIIPSGSSFYQLTYQATEENYKRYLPVAEEIMQSIKIER